MIRSIFIIHESGLCLLSRSYGDESQNIDLYSGFLVAVSSFAKNMIGEKINEIRMEHHIIFYESKKEIVLALVTSGKNISKRKISTIMRRIYFNFVDHYHEFLEQELIEPNIYRDFSIIIDNILETSGLMKLDRSSLENESISSIH
ncbi:MAG: hypothetical protein JSW11_07965 [Candidatus Heimdallarchaeota archaeon]|nr:MAG: hypothetical protein JSW11_07965 [Candidatus Heimdallarchaeota archaeon]